MNEWIARTLNDAISTTDALFRRQRWQGDHERWYYLLGYTAYSQLQMLLKIGSQIILVSGFLGHSNLKTQLLVNFNFNYDVRFHYIFCL